MTYRTKWYSCLCRMCVVYSCWILSGCTEATIHKKNLTREEAGSFSEPLPASASHIYYYVQSGGMQGLTGFARFDVAQEDLHAAVEALIKGNNTQFNRELAFERRELSMIPEEQLEAPRAYSKQAELDWWTPESVTKGYYRGQTESYAVRLWIDEERSRIYLFQLD